MRVLHTNACSCHALQSLDVSQTTLQGTLPPNWGQPQAFPSLRTLNASFTQLTGPLPSAWGSASAFQKLENMSFVGSRVSGGLPDSWGTPGAWPALKAIQIDQTSVSGMVVILMVKDTLCRTAQCIQSKKAVQSPTSIDYQTVGLRLSSP